MTTNYRMTAGNGGLSDNRQRWPARPSRSVCAFVVAFTILGSPYPSDAGGEFARIGDLTISYKDFEQEVLVSARQTFYHGRPSSESAFQEFRRTVADNLVDRHLLLREAGYQGIEPDEAEVATRLAAYEQRYRDTERWQTEGEAMLAALRSRFEQDSRIRALERSVRRTPEPADEDLRAYFTANMAKFTEPPQHRLSVILLALAPSAAPAVRAAARAEAARLSERLRKGADFSELARLHSSDRSASDGGDMGYLHAGMLSPAAEEAIGELSVGEISDPVTVLEGIALFRLTDRRAERQLAFEQVKSRVAELWARDRGEAQWQSRLDELRAAADVFVDTDYLVAAPTVR